MTQRRHPRSGQPSAETGSDDALCDAIRLRALELTGLGSASDPAMERFAGWVRRALDVPTALVSLVQSDRQVFPGMSGLSEPFATARSTPLTHSFCRHVIAAAEPLVISDARVDVRVADNLAVPELGVIGYAGMPLTDEQGNVLGSLCAIDGRPRDWTDAELAVLADIAWSCSTDLRLRLARHDAQIEDERRDQIEQSQQDAYEHSQTLLTASQAFTTTATVDDVRARIGELLASRLRPAFSDAVLFDRGGVLHRLPLGVAVGDASVPASRGAPLPVDERMPSVVAIREQRLVHYRDQSALAAHHPPAIGRMLSELGLQTIVAAPVPGSDGPAGSIVLGWEQPDAVGSTDLLTIATIAGYAGQAISRARTLEHRITVAHEMQDAMLTVLPTVQGLPMAARYLPADARQNVGGDWYDASPLNPTTDDHHVRDYTVSVGDVIGHDLPAVTVMGQARSMLRQAAWDHPDGTPSQILTAFETANLGLGVGAAGTAVIAHLRRLPHRSWLLRWTNAGHPPPILLLPDGSIELLTDHDPLFGFDFTIGSTRADHERVLAAGTTLFLYSDGLVERRGVDLDVGTDALLAVLGGVRDGDPEEIVDVAVRTVPGDAHDDVVALAVRLGTDQ